MNRPLLWVLALVCFGAPGIAGAERIREFQADVRLLESGEFQVEERILYDFEGVERHGIFRDVPIRYGRGSAADYRIALEVEAVTDAAGASRPFSLSSEGAMRRIKIGSREHKLTGVQEYRIRYRVRRGILWFDEHDELYWNATGTGWQVPIDSAAVQVQLPGDVSGEVRFLCFTGRLGSIESACSGARTAGGVAFTANRRFAPGEGLTVAVSLPKGALREPSALAKALDRASDYLSWALALPFLVFFGMGALWRNAGRDPSGPVAIPVRYEPPEDMTPAEMGTVLDEKVDMIDITATLLDLAVRGYLQIEEKQSKKFIFLSETDYVLHRSTRSDADLKPHEERILTGLFGGLASVELSALRNEFYSRLPGIREALYAEVSQDGRWFPTRPDEVRNRYTWLPILLAGGLAVPAFGFGNLPLAISLGISGAVAAFWGRHMPRKTRKGRRARQHILGFKEFVERVERDRLERLEQWDVGNFEKLLPYAFVLGVADAWADAFADLYTEPPSWYASHHGGDFRPRLFVSQLGRSLETAGNVMGSTPNRGSGSSGFSSGGGFSGGGMGGGGGGSW